MSNTARKVIAVISGVILVLGIISCVFVPDETTILMVALLAILYVIYLVNLSKRLKEEKKTDKKSDSPLLRRR